MKKRYIALALAAGLTAKSAYNDATAVPQEYCEQHLRDDPTDVYYGIGTSQKGTYRFTKTGFIGETFTCIYEPAENGGTLVMSQSLENPF